MLTRRLVIVLLALAPAVLVAAALYWIAQRERDSAQQLLREKAIQLAASVDAELNRTVAVLRTLAQSEALRTGDLQRFHALATRIVVNDPQIENVQLIGSAGQHLVNARLPFGAPLPPLNRIDLPMRAAFTRQPVISDVEMAAVAKRMLTVVYVPVVGSGAVDHVIAAAIEPPNWKGVLREKLPLEVEAVLLDRHSFVITSTLDATHRARARSALDASALTQPGALAGDFKLIRAQGGEGLYFAEQRASFSGWQVVTFMRRQEAGVLHEHRMLFLAIGALGFLAYLFALRQVFARAPVT